MKYHSSLIHFNFGKNRKVSTYAIKSSKCSLNLVSTYAIVELKMSTFATEMIKECTGVFLYPRESVDLCEMSSYAMSSYAKLTVPRILTINKHGKHFNLEPFMVKRLLELSELRIRTQFQGQSTHDSNIHQLILEEFFKGRNPCGLVKKED